MISAISVKDRLKNQAVTSGKTFQEALTAYGLERTVYRLSVSEYVERFTLKGGIFLYALFEGEFARATRDIDLLARNMPNNVEDMKKVFANIFSIECDDALRYDLDTLEVIDITEFKEYHVVYCKYYEVVYILFHTGMRISEFCGLTLKDIDLKNKTVNIDHQLQRTSAMDYVIQSTKTNAGTRVLPITDEVADMFRAIIEDRPTPKVEKMVDGYSGFLFLDDKGMPLVAMHWEHRFNHMVARYNEIYKVQMPNITPHVCRHTYCSNMAKSGMNPKTLQYLMGHSDIGVTLNVYTHVGLDDASKELEKMQGLETARKEMGLSDKDDHTVSQKLFKAI